MIGSVELSHLPETRASDEQGYIAEGRNILHGVCCRGLKTDKMSLENTKSAVNRHGFANAIFSSSPINFNKENRSPPERNKHVNHQELRFPTSAKSCKPNTNSNLHSSTRKLNTDNITPVKSGLVRSSSATTLCRQNSLLPFKSSSEEKLRTPMKTASNPRLSADKTPVTHFCTPRRGSNPKMNVSTPARTPTKRYFNTSNVPPATPECFNSVHLETPRAKQDTGMEEQTLCEGETSNLTVGVRVRPLSLKELNDSRITPIVEVNGQNITVNCDSSQHTFTYDHCFVSHADSSIPDHASQETVFKNMVLPLVDNAFEGYNACLFAYGQTGSGKSYSMMGMETGVSVLGPEAGIIPRFCHEIFSRAAKDTDVTTNVEISYFEIYNEKIHDLLVSNSGGGKRAPLKVREHPDIGPYVVDLSQHGVDTYEDLQAWLRVGNSQRVTAATGMNEKSSRSHSIFSVLLTRTRSEAASDRKNVEPSRKCKINLVDLAGSERLSHTCASGDRLREGVSINKSLLTLGKVIGSLAENTSNRKRGFVPYRESVLTWLLRESLGGNSRTAMLGTVSPANMHLEETLATLRYACQARAIVNRVRINEDPHDRTIRQLQAEVLRLRAMREGYERQLGVLPRRFFDCTEPAIESAEEIRTKEREIELLKEQLKRTEDQLAFTQKSWLEKLQDADKRRNTELKYLRRCGIAVEIDLREKSTQPCLINLAADPILSGTLLYLIPPGLVRVGRRGTDGKTSREPDIVLDGPLIRQLHCTIENDDGKLVLSPNMEGETYINGQMVTDKVRLNHGDRLIIGGNHYFKVSNPLDNENNMQTAGQPVDFEFAHQEILKAQEEKLRVELEESKKRAMKELENAKHEVEMQLGSQKFTYEREIEALGLTLEQQKLALEEINRKKKELELEKEMLLSEVETNNRVRKIQSDESRTNIVPYCSNFLQDLEDILNLTTADAETALKMKISDEAMKSGGVSLHEMQLLVREATERCREVGINYEFDQQQVVAEKGLQPVIRVRDKDRRMETLWQPMRFLDWVHRLRDYDIEDSIKELRDSEDDWEAYEDTEVVEDSLVNNSRISINMTPIKKQLNESLLQMSLDASFFDNTMADQTSESVRLQRNNDIAACLQQIVVATKTLGKLCHEYEDREISGMVTKSLDKVHDIMNGVRNILENRSACVSSNASGLGSTANEDTECTDIETRDVTASKQKLSDCNSPSTKSTLRTTGSCPFVKNGNGQKSVRFDFK